MTGGGRVHRISVLELTNKRSGWGGRGELSLAFQGVDLRQVHCVPNVVEGRLDKLAC